MSNDRAVKLIESMLHNGMVESQMHGCIRDVGRQAGGYAASGVIDPMELFQLGSLVESLSINASEGLDKWEKAVKYGRDEPLHWDDNEMFKRKEEKELGWNDTIGNPDDYHIVDTNYLQGDEVPDPGENWDQVADLTTYLSNVFQPEELVSYVTKSYLNEKSGKHLPKRGCWDRSAGTLIEALAKCNGDIHSVIGDCDPEVGAWIRFNPVDGPGDSDKNITEHRYNLVESDVQSIEKQYAIMKELELPIVALVNSGGKSLHAIVRVDAEDYKEYRKRVDFLWDICQRNGLTLDTQNRNPSRLSRLPGVMRNGNKQYLVASNIGKANWNEWKEWIEDINDDLEDIEELVLGETEPILADTLIEGVLREGHKMLLAGPSKAAKSFALMQLCIAISEGRKWFDWNVKKGRVLYVNLELDKRSSEHRFWKIYQELGITQTPGNLDVWNLRGKAVPLDKLAPKLIRRAHKKQYSCVIIDPIYKVITGDENSAEAMAHFTNQFDKICLQLDTAVVIAHHHSKGAQGDKKSMDRASGSGVFSRDPDTIMDLIELNVNDSCRKQLERSLVIDALVKEGLHEHDLEALNEDKIDKIVGFLESQFDMTKEQADVLMAGPVFHAREESKHMTAWRIETTLREFAPHKPVKCWFKYPTHISDRYMDILADAKAEGELERKPASRKATEKGETAAMKKATAAILKKCEKQEADRRRVVELYDIVDRLSKDGECTTSDIQKAKLDFWHKMDLPAPKTIRDWLDVHPNITSAGTGRNAHYVISKPLDESMRRPIQMPSDGREFDPDTDWTDPSKTTGGKDDKTTK